MQNAVYLKERWDTDAGLMQYVLNLPPGESAARVSELEVLQQAAFAKNEAIMSRILKAQLSSS